MPGSSEAHSSSVFSLMHKRMLKLQAITIQKRTSDLLQIVNVTAINVENPVFPELEQFLIPSYSKLNNDI